MKKTPLLRITSALLAVLLLAGCSTDTISAPSKRKKKNNKTETTETTAAADNVSGGVSKAEGKEMPKKQMEQAIYDMEMAVLLAGLDANRRSSNLTKTYSVSPTQVVYADYNQDGQKDVLLGKTNHLKFSLSPQRSADYTFSQSAPVYFTDNDGNLYMRNGVCDGYDVEVNGKEGWSEYLEFWYDQWIDGDWQTVYSYGGSIVTVDTTGFGGTIVTQEVENTVTATIQGAEGTKQELDAHFETIGMREIETQLSDYLSCTYDVKYRDSLLNGLHDHFFSTYGGYTQMLTGDIDGDGAEEVIYLLPNFEDVWVNSLNDVSGEGDIEGARHWFKAEFSDEFQHTAVIIADETDGELTLNVHCALDYFTADSVENMYLEKGYLYINSSKIYLDGGFTDVQGTEMYAALNTYLANYGYTNCFFRIVDVTDLEGTEYMCIGKINGEWNVSVIMILEGNPRTVYTQRLYDTAVYLTEYQGQQCLMTYSQSMYEEYGETITNYMYDTVRVDAGGEVQVLDAASASFTSSEEDATAASTFFQRLNVYLTKFVVVRDPYRITGKTWMEPGQAEYGTVPAEEIPVTQQPSQPEQPEQPEQPQEEEKTVMGFVQIKYAHSWLNLRVGPGVQYDKVLMDPNDPESFVKQALGSPVTVLETIETGDPDNPVWVKIRITYGNREFVGYSSKKYIRLADE